MQIEKVVAITVTYNRSKTLINCLRALLNQTRKPDRIIVIDNYSVKKEQEAIEAYVKGREDITVIWLNENLGGAGGFEAGMRYARKYEQPDWYWMMDDDAYPKEDCLELLLEQGTALENVGCVAPAIFGIDINEYQLYHHKKLSWLLFEDIQVAGSYDTLAPVTQIEANAFVGPLFSRDAVEQAGIADGSLFIYGDDTEYTYRVSRVKNIYLIRDAVIEHQDPPVSNNYMQPKAWWKEYYRIRNRFFLYREFHKEPLKCLAANMCMTAVTVKFMVAAAIKPKYHGYRRLRIGLLGKAVIDGFLNKRGRQVDPVEYAKRL